MKRWTVSVVSCCILLGLVLLCSILLLKGKLSGTFSITLRVCNFFLHWKRAAPSEMKMTYILGTKDSHDLWQVGSGECLLLARYGTNARRNLWSAKNFICLISVDFECTRRLHPVKRCLSVFKCFLLVLVFFFLVKTGDFRSSYPYFWSQNQLWLMCSLNLALGRLQVVMWSWNLKQPFWKEF